MTDIFQEVEEEVRRERYEALWKKYGVYFLAALVAVVVGVAGYKAWVNHDIATRQKISDRFDAALQLAVAGNGTKAKEEFQALSKDAPAGYAKFARFQLAGIMLAEGKRDPALVLLHGLANDSDALVSSAARLRLAWLLVDSAPRAEVDDLLKPLTAADSSWRFAASEVKAYQDLHEEKRAEAQAAYEKLAADIGAPQGLRKRAGAIAQFLKANPGAINYAPAAPQPTATAPQSAPAAIAAPETKTP